MSRAASSSGSLVRTRGLLWVPHSAHSAVQRNVRSRARMRRSGNGPRISLSCVMQITSGGNLIGLPLVELAHQELYCPAGDRFVGPLRRGNNHDENNEDQDENGDVIL